MGGKPCGTFPSSFTPRAPNESADAATIPPTTTKSDTGLFFKKILPKMSTASAVPPTRSDVGLVSCRCLKKLLLFSQKSPCAPGKPRSLGSCVLARKRATPHLKPVITLSEMKFTMTPAFTSQAMNAIEATSNAVPAASAPKRVVSPAAISPSDAPVSNEIADVTVTTVYRELQNNQKSSPPNRHA